MDRLGKHLSEALAADQHSSEASIREAARAFLRLQAYLEDEEEAYRHLVASELVACAERLQEAPATSFYGAFLKLIPFAVSAADPKGTGPRQGLGAAERAALSAVGDMARLLTVTPAPQGEGVRSAA